MLPPKRNKKENHVQDLSKSLVKALNYVVMFRKVIGRKNVTRKSYPQVT